MIPSESLKILIAIQETATREMVEFTLDLNTKATLTFVKSADEAIDLIRERNSFNAVICDEKLEGKYKNSDAVAIYRHLQSLHSEAAYVLCGDFAIDEHSYFKTHPEISLISPNDIYKNLAEIVSKNSTDSINSEYSRVRSSIALRFGLLRCDLYTKLGDGHFVKVLREGDMLDLLDLQRFESKKIDYYYIKSEDAKKVMERLSEEFSKLSSEPELPFDSIVRVSTTTLEMISDFSHSCGFSNEVQKLTKLSINLSLKTIQKNPKLKNLYNRLVVQPDRYLVSHSVLLAHVSCGIASLIGMTSESTFYRLALASFLHDMALDNDELAKIQDLADLKAHQDQFSSEERLRYRVHPNVAADQLASMTEIPPDIHTIVREHHERPDGSGFPNGLTHPKLSMLSSLFIFAEHLIHFQTLICTTPDLGLYINSIPPSFYKGNFLPITEAFIRSVNENE